MNEQSLVFMLGIIVAVASYFIKNFVLDPLLECRKIKGKIQNKLKYHANVITNGELPIHITRPVSAQLRQLSCDLEEAYYAIALVKRIYSVLILPTPHELSQIASKLIFLSNTAGSDRHIDNNIEAIDFVKTKLGII